MKTILSIFISLFLTIMLVTAQDSLYVYKANVVTYKCKIADADSITFAKKYPFPATGTVADNDGHTYTYTTIGTQVWMTQNLKTTKYNDGTAITDGNAPGFVATTPAYCHYGGGGANTATYGLMYNGYAVATGKLAPVGWHVATNADWIALADYCGGKLVAAGKLKEAGAVHWGGENVSTNEFNFTAIGGGYGEMGSAGSFNSQAVNGFWWTTTTSPAGCYSRCMIHNSTEVIQYDHPFKYGFSVLCVKD